MRKLWHYTDLFRLLAWAVTKLTGICTSISTWPTSMPPVSFPFHEIRVRQNTENQTSCFGFALIFRSDIHVSKIHRPKTRRFRRGLRRQLTHALRRDRLRSQYQHQNGHPKKATEHADRSEDCSVRHRHPQDQQNVPSFGQDMLGIFRIASHFEWYEIRPCSSWCSGPERKTAENPNFRFLCSFT